MPNAAGMSAVLPRPASPVAAGRRAGSRRRIPTDGAIQVYYSVTMSSRIHGRGAVAGTVAGRTTNSL